MGKKGAKGDVPVGAGLDGGPDNGMVSNRAVGPVGPQVPDSSPVESGAISGGDDPPPGTSAPDRQAPIETVEARTVNPLDTPDASELPKRGRGRRTKAELAIARAQEQAAEAQASAKEAAALLADAERATRGLVKVASSICRRFLPPEFSEDEITDLSEAWAPLVARIPNAAQASPWIGAAIQTVAALGPRVLARVERKPEGSSEAK